MPEHDILIIGAGPGGYVAAIRAAQLGFDVGVVEKEPLLGGTCVRIGCIPSKALLESSERFEMAQHALAEHGVDVEGVKLDLERMQARKAKVVKANADGVAFLFKKNKITRYQGSAALSAPGTVTVRGEKGESTVQAEHVILASGSRVAPLKGVEIDGERVITSTEALELSEVPERLIVIGAGIIGLELGSVWRRLGAKVTVLEYLERILPGVDGEIAKEALKLFKRQGLEFHLGARVTAARKEGEGAVVEVEGMEPLRAERVLLATGRLPNTEGLGLEAAGVETDERGRIKVDARFRTSAPGIYAIGDVIQGPMLAHKASEDGVACVELIATGAGRVDYGLVPSVVYTEPEIASAGQTEEALEAAGRAYRKGSFPFQANGRARAMGLSEGKVKVLADAESDRVLGVHIIGPRAGELIAEAVAAMTFGASSEDVARTVHAHPTLAEALKEAALAVAGEAIHI